MSLKNGYLILGKQQCSEKRIKKYEHFIRICLIQFICKLLKRNPLFERKFERSLSPFGFFTLSNISLERKNLTIRSAYSTVPATLLGRMAVSVLHQHKGYARYMVANAIELCQQSPSATRALVVDAKDETVLDFYLHLNFFRLSETGLRAVLLLPKRSL